MDAGHDLELLIRARTRLIAIDTFDEARVVGLVRRVARSLRVPFFRYTVTDGLRPEVGAPLPGTTDVPAALEQVKQVGHGGVFIFKDLAERLSEPAIARKLKDLLDYRTSRPISIVIVAPSVRLPDLLVKHAARVDLALPSDEELGSLVWKVLAEFGNRTKVKMALDDAGFTRLVHGLRGLTFAEAERAIGRAIADDQALTEEDLQGVVETRREILEAAGAIEFVPAGVGLEEIGGLAGLKAWLLKRAHALTAEGRDFGLEAPKGIVLLGVQGCGKSLAARAVASAWDIPLLRLEPGRIYDKYIGESDKHLEQALRAADHMSPCVLWIDEIEKGFAAFGNSEADGGLSRRIFGRLLGWLQERKSSVFVVATCNDVASLPPELMRKGRFDEVFFVDLPTPSERETIFRIHLARRDRDPADFDLEALVQGCEGYSGAEIEQAIVSALYTAFGAGGTLTTQMILDELAATRPLSVTRAEDVQALRAWAAGRAVDAGG